MNKLCEARSNAVANADALPWWGAAYLAYKFGKGFLRGKYYNHFLDGALMDEAEAQKQPTRTSVINHLLSVAGGETHYLEIGVRNPRDNFLRVNAGKKHGVDPGVEFKENPVDFKMTSDEFFHALGEGKILSADTKFDVIFIDGLHLAEQVDRDISNALRHIKDGGFVVLHDCNPPSEWHARENYRYRLLPSRGSWNGTTWKAFLKWRCNPAVYSCCIDADYGVGVLSKSKPIGQSIDNDNLFYEYHVFEQNRVCSGQVKVDTGIGRLGINRREIALEAGRREIAEGRVQPRVVVSHNPAG